MSNNPMKQNRSHPDEGAPTLLDAQARIEKILANNAEHLLLPELQGIPHHAAAWMLDHVHEPPQLKEAPRRIKLRPSGTAWKWPFMDRVIGHTLRFIRLSLDDQRYIVAVREDGIVWRGYDIPQFRMLVADHYAMLESGENFKEEGRKRFMELLRNKKCGADK